jgi:hypothetical protein
MSAITLEIVAVRPVRSKWPQFDAYWNGELIVRSREPLFAAARKLLELGIDPAALMTMRHRGAAFDSYVPAPAGHLAAMTVSEGTFRGLTFRKWRPRDAGAGS